MPYYRAVVQAAAPTPERIGVLLVNLGTPDSPSYFAVQRYLREFLGDRRVINTSRLIWLPILYGVVLPFRPIRTARNYRKIWMQDGSPLAVYSKRLAIKIGDAAARDAGGRGARRARHDLRQSQHRERDRLARRAEREAAAGAASLSAVLLIDHGLGVRSHQPRVTALALAAGDPLRQRLLRRCRLHRRVDRAHRGALGRSRRALASAVLLSRHTGGLRARRAIRIRRRPKRRPAWSCRVWGWQRRNGRIAISRDSARWSGCSPTRRTR